MHIEDLDAVVALRAKLDNVELFASMLANKPKDAPVSLTLHEDRSSYGTNMKILPTKAQLDVTDYETIIVSALYNSVAGALRELGVMLPDRPRLVTPPIDAPAPLTIPRLPAEQPKEQGEAVS